MPDRDSQLRAIARADIAVKTLQEQLDGSPGNLDLSRRLGLAESTLRVAAIGAASDPDISWDDIAGALDVSVDEARRRYGPPDV